MRLVCTLVLAAFQTLAFAQASRPGYVVVEGDTLRGQIHIGTEGEAAAGARFQGSADSSPRQIRTEDASAFGEDDGRAYRRGRFTIQPLPPSAPSPAAGFARVVRDGAAALLRFETGGGLNVFVLELDGERTPLYVLERGVEGAPRVPGVAEYRQVLLGRLGTCEAVASQASSARYEERDLAAVVDAYNACHDPRYVVREAEPARRAETRIRLDLSGGYSTSSFKRANPSATRDPRQSSVQLGALAEISPGTLARTLAIVVGADYDLGTVRRVNRPVLTASTKTTHDAVTFSLGGRITVPAARTPIYLGGGILTGKTVERVGGEIAAGEEPPSSYVPNTTRQFLSSLGGYYVEAGARPLGERFGIGVRYRAITFSQKVIYLPGDTNRDDRYGLRSVQLLAVARL